MFVVARFFRQERIIRASIDCFVEDKVLDARTRPCADSDTWTLLLRVVIRGLPKTPICGPTVAAGVASAAWRTKGHMRVKQGVG